MEEILDGILVYTYCTILLELDGEASIGGKQFNYKIYDEDNDLLSMCRELEAEA